MSAPVLIALTPTQAHELRVALLAYRHVLKGRGQPFAPDLDQLAAFLTAAADNVPTGTDTGRQPSAANGRSTDDQGMELLTYADAAEVARCSRRTIERRVAAGDLPVVRLGPRTVRIRRTDLDRTAA